MACEYLFEGKWYTEKELRSIYNQGKDQKTLPSKASAATLKKIKEFLDRIAVDVKSVPKITYNGKTLGVNGLADPLNSLIQVVEGKEDIALTEEAMHIAVELLAQKNPGLFKEMMDRIGRYNLYNRVVSEYQNNPFYQTEEGKPDIRKIKKEAIGKVLAQTAINKNENANEKPELLDQTRTWWQKIVDFLKDLFFRAGFNPFESAANKVLKGKLKGPIQSNERNPFASRKPEAVNASMKLVSSLRDPKAQKWFDSLYLKGQRDQFFTKVQHDLQAPKGQVEMLKKWVQTANPQSVGDMIAGILSQLSYTVEISTAMNRIDNTDKRDYDNFTIGNDSYRSEFIVFEKVREEDEDSGFVEYTKNGEYVSPQEYDIAYEEYREINKQLVPSQAYVNLNVPGGVNYRNNEIKTPDITPSIKGHAAFATDQGIGWFRSDDKTARKLPDNVELDKDVNEYTQNGEPISKESATTLAGGATKTRRILEIQSDLFQKGRDKDLLINRDNDEDITFETKYASYAIDPRNNVTIKHENGHVEHTNLRDIQESGRDDSELILSKLKEHKNKASYGRENDFLQLLNKENNWVTFFVKAIIQDSAKKGYESVRFPGGNTAAKIEGHESIEDAKREINEKIRVLENAKGKDHTIFRDLQRHGIPVFRPQDSISVDIHGYQQVDVGAPLDVYSQEEGNNPDYIYKAISLGTYSVKDVIERSIEFQKNRMKFLETEGFSKLSPISSFYQNTVQNILKKQGYKPTEVTDEYGNKWFEIKLEENRDLGEFYFQISQKPIAEQIEDKNALITRRENEFEINGNKIRKSVQQEILDFYRKRLGAQNADKALRGYKQETENRIQVDIKDILSRYIGDDNKLRITPLPQSNPSATDPLDNSFYLTLEEHLKERLNTYEPGTDFMHSVNLYDGINTAGHVDFIAITPEGSVDVLQFKVPQLSQAATDIPVYRQEAYNIEIEAIRKILQVGYKVNRNDFRLTRAIPIKAEYERLAPGVNDMKLSKVTIGNTNVALIQDNSLIPISSESETSGNDEFDQFITRLRALAQKIASERVPPDKRQERTQRVAQLIGAIRNLQVKRNGAAIIDSAKAIIKRSTERLIDLKEKINNTNSDVATIEELNKIAEEILSDKDQIDIYKDLYGVYKNIFNDGTNDSQEIIKDARGISDDANDLLNDYWTLAVKFRSSKFAAKVGIRDEFTPEKKLTWYRRMIRSLSQSSIKAGQILWKLVERINGGFKLEFLDRLAELEKIEKEVDKWMEGKSVKDLYHKIFQFDNKGRWTGKIIQKIDRAFYTDLKKAQEDRDLQWIKDNIDTTEYMRWFTAEHQRRIDEARTARIVADDAENARLINQSLQDFVDNFHIDFRKGVGEYNYKLQDFPREDKWKSAAYQEIEKEKSLLDLYEYYRKRLEESWSLGMLHEHNGWSWFPNIRRGLLEKLSTAPAGNKLRSLFGGIRIEAEDQTFGKIDPITGKPLDEIHANFVSDLFEFVQDADGNYFRDYSEKSMDIFKVIALWDAEILKFKLRVESEGLARLLHYTESDPKRKAYESTNTGKLRKTPEGKPITISNEVNAAYIKEYLDAIYYGKGKSNEFDVAINIPYKSAVEKINKLFGTEILTVPKEETIRISGIKTIEAMNRYFVAKTLGVNITTSLAQLFGGTINTAINQGLYFNKKDILEAEMKYVSGKFYSSEGDKKLAGLVSFLHPYTEDRTSHMIRKMSVSKMVEYLSSDHLFYLQRGSDNWVNTVVALSMIKNTMVENGKLINIRDFARRELGHVNKYDTGYDGSVEFERRLETRVAELQKSPQALINYAQVINDQLILPNIERNGDQVIQLRQKMLEIIKDALGNTSQEDLSLYKRYITWQSFFMFKNWIPRMFDVRFGSLKYSAGTDKYEYGRMRMLVNGVRNLGLGATTSLIAKLGNDPKPLIEVAKKEYARKRENFAEELQNLDMTEAEFIDMYIKGVRSEVRELLLAAGLMAILIAMRVNTPDGEESPEIKSSYRWALRGLDKLTDELTFMYSPSSFTNIFNGSVFPSVGLLVEFEKFFTTVVKKVFWNLMGDEEQANKQKVMKHVYRALPVTKEILNYLAIFNNDIAKEYGIRMNNNYGSVR